MKTERIPFDFSLWGQEGIEVWHMDGRKAVYVGETHDKAFPFIVHWNNKRVTWFDVDSQIIYMTRQVRQKGFYEVVDEVYKKIYGFEPPHQLHYEFSRILLEKAKEEGLI